MPDVTSIPNFGITKPILAGLLAPSPAAPRPLRNSRGIQHPRDTHAPEPVAPGPVAALNLAANPPRQLLAGPRVRGCVRRRVPAAYFWLTHYLDSAARVPRRRSPGKSKSGGLRLLFRAGSPRARARITRAEKSAQLPARPPLGQWNRAYFERRALHPSAHLRARLRRGPNNPPHRLFVAGAVM